MEYSSDGVQSYIFCLSMRGWIRRAVPYSGFHNLKYGLKLAINVFRPGAQL